MSLLWGEDPAHTTTARTPYPDARRDPAQRAPAPVQWQRLAARYGPLPTPTPRAGEIGYEVEVVAPVEGWRRVLVWAVALVVCVACWYGVFLAVPVVGDLIRRVWR